MNGAVSKKAGPGSENLQRDLCLDSLPALPRVLEAGFTFALCRLVSGVLLLSQVCCPPGRSDQAQEEQLCSQD